jgi:hypothetical protein
MVVPKAVPTALPVRPRVHEVPRDHIRMLGKGDSSELLLDPHCLQHIVMASLYVPLCEGCLDVCEQGIAREFEAGYCLRSGERTRVVDATSLSPR